MQRDMELVRKILFAIEEKQTGAITTELNVNGYTGEEIAVHCKMMFEGGLVDFYNETRAGSAQELIWFKVGNLTWIGHDFIDKIREDTIWNKTKNVIKEKGLPMVVDVIKQVSSTIISSMVEGVIKGLKQ